LVSGPALALANGNHHDHHAFIFDATYQETAGREQLGFAPAYDPWDYPGARAVSFFDLPGHCMAELLPLLQGGGQDSSS